MKDRPIAIICESRREYDRYLSDIPRSEWHKYSMVLSKRNTRGLRFSSYRILEGGKSKNSLRNEVLKRMF